MNALDMTDAEVRVGDVLADARGRTFTVLETEPSFLRSQMVRVLPTTGRRAEPTILRLAFALRVDAQRLHIYDQRDLAALFASAYEKIRPARRAALLARKDEITGPPKRGRRGGKR